MKHSLVVRRRYSVGRHKIRFIPGLGQLGPFRKGAL